MNNLQLRPASDFGPHHRILVVDSDEDIRQLSVDVLAGSSYHVEAVQDGAAGWEALQSNRYDLIITDHPLPGMTGMEIIERLHSAHRSPPVIMAARHLPAYELSRKPWLKPAATLPRPFAIDDLLAAVKKILCRDELRGVPAPVPATPTAPTTAGTLNSLRL